MDAFVDSLPEEIRGFAAKAISEGIKQTELAAVLEAYPALLKKAWWNHNASETSGQTRRAVKHRLEMINLDAFNLKAAKWTTEELREIAKSHKAGKPVDTDKLAEAAARGIISVSSAMNSDF